MLVALWARLLSLLYRWSFAEVIAAFISATSQCESMQVKDAAVEGLCYDVFSEDHVCLAHVLPPISVGPGLRFAFVFVCS